LGTGNKERNSHGRLGAGCNSSGAICAVDAGPGLLFQLPGNSRAVEFANMQTSGVSILVHTIIYFGLITIFLIAIGVHISTG
jgi:hypothetical protein